MHIHRIPGISVNALTNTAKSAAKPAAPPSEAPASGARPSVQRQEFAASRIELIGKLQQLEQADPEQFQSILQGMADSLHESAAAGGLGSAQLERVASRYDTAAASGELDDLRPAVEAGAEVPKTTPLGGVRGFALGGLGLLKGSSDLISTMLDKVNEALNNLSTTPTPPGEPGAPPAPAEAAPVTTLPVEAAIVAPVSDAELQEVITVSSVAQGG